MPLAPGPGSFSLDRTSPPPDTVSSFVSGPPPVAAWLWEGRLVGAGDGSGGEHSSDRRLRRAGWAVTVADARAGLGLDGVAQLAFSRLLSGAEPCKFQTVNRAKLFALYQFLLETREFPRLLYIVDTGYVVKGVKRCLATLPHASNADLWKQVAALLKDRDLVCLEVESHLSIAEVFAQGVPPGAYLANRVVDTAAGKAAESCQLSCGDVESLRLGEALAASVRSRCAATFLAAVEADVRAPPVATESAGFGHRLLKGRIAASDHEVLRRGRNFLCVKCHSRTAVRGSRRWLSSACRPGDNVAEGVHRGSVVIGSRAIHASHQHRYHEGLALHFCATCGSFTRSQQMRNLAGVCSGRPTIKGASVLRCIEKGKLPTTVTRQPDHF